MRISDVVCNKYLEDRESLVSFDKKVPKGFYKNVNGNYAELKLIKMPKRVRNDLHNRMKGLEMHYGVKFPIELYQYVISYWKSYLEFIYVDPEDETYEINYVFFETLPGKELDVLIRDMETYYGLGGDRKYVPVGFDDVGNWVLLNSDDGGVWLEDVDFNEYRKLDSNLCSFLNQLQNT